MRDPIFPKKMKLLCNPGKHAKWEISKARTNILLLALLEFQKRRTTCPVAEIAVPRTILMGFRQSTKIVAPFYVQSTESQTTEAGEAPALHDI